MPFNMSYVRNIIVLRCGASMARAGMSVDTSLIPNIAFDDPIARALDYLGIPPADRTLPVDADLAQISAPPVIQGQFLDLCEIFTFETALKLLMSKPQQQQWSTYSVTNANQAQLSQTMIDTLWSIYRDRYEKSAQPGVANMTREVRGEYIGPFVNGECGMTPYHQYPYD
jgi:hypothetical protein